MNSIQLFILSLTLTLSFSFRCLVSRCPTTPFIDNQCSYHDTMEGREVYEFKQCPLNHYCLYKNEFKINFCRSLDIRSLPGDQCTSHSDCVTDLCDNNICQGKKEGDDCDTNFQCSIGFACINQRCTVKKKKTKTAQVMRIVRTVLDVLALGNVLRISHFMSETIVRNPCCVRQWRTMNLDIVRSLR